MAGFLLDLRVALLNLVEHRRRSAFLCTAIAVATCAFVLMGALSAGVVRSVVDTATALSTGHLNVGGYFKVTSGQVAPLVADYGALRDLLHQTTPELEFVAVRGRGIGKVVTEQGSLETVVYGVDIAHEPKLGPALSLVSGDLVGLSERNTIMIFDAHAKKLGVRVGDALTITAQTPRGAANTIDCRVVAIARDVGLISQWSVFVPNDTVRTLYQLNSQTAGVLQLHLKPSHLDALPAVAARVRKVLAQRGYRVMPADTRPSWMKWQAVAREEWTGQKLDVTTWQDELLTLTWTLNALRALSALLVAILAAIIVIGIMNTLWISIRERTREIGALRALGMQRAQVVRLFMFEATLLGVFGAGAGVALGAALTSMINAAQLRVPLSVQLLLVQDTLVLALEPHSALTAVVLISAISAAAALFPSLRAARLSAVDAMAHVG